MVEMVSVLPPDGVKIYFLKRWNQEERGCTGESIARAADQLKEPKFNDRGTVSIAFNIQETSHNGLKWFMASFAYLVFYGNEEVNENGEKLGFAIVNEEALVSACNVGAASSGS